jgi:hypothetical protein
MLFPSIGFTDCQRLARRLPTSQWEDPAMRLALPLAALALLAVPAYAQTTPPAVAPSPTSAAVPQATAAPASAAPAPHPRLGMDQRFGNANTTHDGHLTLDQAKAGYPTVAKHFTQIDATKKGYITEDDIRAWEKAQRDRRHEAQQPAATPNKS